MAFPGSDSIVQDFLGAARARRESPRNPGLLTCNPVLTWDVFNLFHYLTGRAQARDCTTLLVAPTTMRPRIPGLIRREMENRKAGADCGKDESAGDPDIIGALCEASKAGVGVDLIIRGFCCLRPGAPGENGKYPRAFNNRAISGAFAGISFREWERRSAAGRIPSRVGGLDGAESIEAGGSGDSDSRAGA
jgi:hypothetical protein